MKANPRNKWVALYLGAILMLSVFAPPLATAALAMGSGLAGVIGDTTSLSDMDSAMKIIFEDTLVNNAVTESELMDEFEAGGGIKTDMTTGGRYIETAQLFNLPAGFGFRSSGGYIPIPRGPQIENSRINMKKGIATLEIEGDVLKRCRSDIGAYIDWGEKAFPTLLERVKNKMDSSMLGYGSGLIARVNDASPAVELVVDSPLGIGGLGTSEDALLQFLAGETLRASPNADGSSPRTGTMVVENVDFENNYVKVDVLATALADNDFLFGGDSAGNDAGLAFTGLFGHIDNGDILGTYQNIDRADWSAWRAHVFDAQAIFGDGTKLTEKLITRADNTAFTRGGAVVDLLVTSRLGVEQLWDDLKGDRSIVDPRSYTGGKGKIYMLLGDRMVEVKVARKMPSTCLFGITKKTFKKFVVNEFEWDTTTGGLWKQVTDSTGRKDAFYAYGTLQMEFGGSDPQKNWRIENIAN